MLNFDVNYAVQDDRYASWMETMGDRIKLLREAKGLTQGELGKKVGVTKSAVSQWEGGQTANIKLQTFLSLLETLSVKYEYLVYGPSRGPGGGRGVSSRAAKRDPGPDSQS